MAHSLWSDRPLGVTLAGLDEVAGMATSPHSSVARFRY